MLHRKALLQQPHRIIPGALFGVVRSSSFLALYISLCFAGTCGLSNVTGKITGLQLALGVAPSGLATLVEKPSRRVELAMYCTARVSGLW